MKEKATEQIAQIKRAPQAEDGGKAPAPGAVNKVLTPEEIDALLIRPEVLDAVLANEAICNEVIARYLSELYEQRPAPVLRGKSALCPIPRPHTLQEAKKIVDND
ncbi:MAG: hypothetical protein K2M95_00230 [Clostridiales bacterium]|nr:hypothetical protein [Clostridiales bacterium]